MKTAKYRPCFSEAHISHILSLCKQELSDKSLSVISVLAPFKAKIDNNCISPAYAMKERESLYGSLGIEGSEECSGLTPAEKRKRAFDKWNENPDSCNVSELELVQTYRMDNDLLSTEERERINAEWMVKYGYPCC